MALNFPLNPVDGEQYDNFTWNEAVGVWQFSAPIALDNLTDVEVTNPTTDDLLYYDGTQWVNASPQDLNVGGADVGVLFWMYAQVNMAEILPKLLYIGNLQSGNAYVTSSTSGSYAIIKSINICNTGTATETFSINIIPPGSTKTVANSIMGNITLTAGNVFSYDTSIVVPAGHAIYLEQPTNNLTFAISGVDYVV